MAQRLTWRPGFSVGDEILDAQHQAILARCDALADCLAAAGEAADREFRRVFDELMTLAREHFASEQALLPDDDAAAREAARNEREEFDYLAAEILTTENFDKDELQRFLALWWTGHVVGAASRRRMTP